MRRHIPISISVLTVAMMLFAGPMFAQDAPGVTAAGKASLPAGALLNGIPVSGLLFGIGVYVPGDGTAAGSIQVTLAGTTLLGLSQTIELTGDAATGTINADGSRTISGTATLDLGNGLPPLPGVPFTVIANATGLILSVASTTLPAAPLTAGVIQIQ
jgi:hypothetical protein